MDAPLLGREINGRYRLTAGLGEGAMGTVYRAERLDGGGAVAMKVLQEDTSEDPELRTRFEREARALFGLQHPNILDVQDYGVIDGRQPYLVMELLTGQSLDQAIDAESIDLPSALEIARQFLTGLAFAHERGVLHRDLKTENLYLMRGPDGRPVVKLLDFGLVKFVDGEKWGDDKKLTMAGSVLGSPAYMSPEQGAGGAVDARSDVYSAAIVLYELLTGTWPFMAESRMEMLKQHLLTPIPAVAAGRPELLVDPAVDAVFQVALAKDPKSRYPDARALLAAWQALPQPPVRLPAPTRSVPPPPAVDLASVRPAAPGQMPPVNLPPGPAPGGYAPPVHPHAGPAMAAPGAQMAPGSPDPRLAGQQVAATHDFEQSSGGGQRLLIIALAAVLILLCLASIGVAALLSLSA